jgi:ProP effector
MFALDPTAQAKRADDLIGLLAKRFPLCFAVDESRRKPLKIGIGNDIKTALGDEMTVADLALALRYYCGNPAYLSNCVEGSARIDLTGRAVGVVSSDQAEHARNKLNRQLEQKINSVANGHLKEAPPSRASLADLRLAPARRKGGGQ